MKITKDTVVFFRYRLTDAEEQLIEDVRDAEPIAILHGHGNVIPGLERAFEGHEAGDSFTVNVPPADGYGDIQPDQVQRVSKKYFGNPKKLKVGMQTHLQTKQGQRMVTVVKIGGKVIDVDLNHPLAGQTLNFAVEIDQVREATASELAHGHAHADGHDHH